jgi:hypothetical protein
MLNLENILTRFLGKPLEYVGGDKVPFKLRVFSIRLYENVISKF